MSFTNAIKSGFRNYLNFRGRASRSEFWWWTLFAILVQTITVSMGDIVNSVASLVMLLPGLSMNVRRLHDVGRSGKWLLATVISLAVAIGSFLWIANLAGLNLNQPESWESDSVINTVSPTPIAALSISLVVTLVIGLANFFFTLQKSKEEMNAYGPPPPPKA